MLHYTMLSPKLPYSTSFRIFIFNLVEHKQWWWWLPRLVILSLSLCDFKAGVENLRPPGRIRGVRLNERVPVFPGHGQGLWTQHEPNVSSRGIWLRFTSVKWIPCVPGSFSGWLFSFPRSSVLGITGSWFVCAILSSVPWLLFLPEDRGSRSEER